MLLPKRKKKRVVVFVCTGNTCRSPMAQGLLQSYLDEKGLAHIEVRTAGVMTIPGLLPTPEAVQVMDAASIDIKKHRSAPLTPEMIRKADLILGMTPFHVQFALRLSDEARNRTFLLKEYTKSDLKNYQITDPMGATLEVYKRVFREIKLAIERLCEMDSIHAPLDQELKHEKWDFEAARQLAKSRPKPVIEAVRVSTPATPSGKLPAPKPPAAKPADVKKAPPAKPAPKGKEAPAKKDAPKGKAPAKPAPKKK